MASQDKLFLPEEQYANYPPLFNGTNYGYSMHVTKNGPFEPQKLEYGLPIENEFNELTRKDKEQLKTISKALNLEPNEFNRVSTSKIVKKIWDKLEVTHEGITRVKDSRISLLLAQDDEFKMKLGESISEMNSRFTHIINELNNLGEETSFYRQNDKLLKALPKSRETRKITLHENDNFRTISSEELL
ncbi:uncharacterized protein [Aristolochia californica]|uniref:uncharacterized protein n=1 Tax=Aristolochia californica TaxID=171875 RepID=UPI0035D7A1C4